MDARDLPVLLLKRCPCARESRLWIRMRLSMDAHDLPSSAFTNVSMHMPMKMLIRTYSPSTCRGFRIWGSGKGSLMCSTDSDFEPRVQVFFRVSGFGFLTLIEQKMRTDQPKPTPQSPTSIPSNLLVAQQSQTQAHTNEWSGQRAHPAILESRSQS